VVKRPAKRTEQLPPLRVSGELLDAIKDLSFRADRSVSDYVRWVLVCHVYGHGRKLDEIPTERD